MGSKVTKTRSKAIIALGGNLPLGEMPPQDILVAAIEDLTLLLGEACQISRLFQTPCFPAGAGPDYINAVVTVETSLSPMDLLLVLHEVEQKYSRVRDQRWGMRTLDLDLVAVEDRVLPDSAGYQYWYDLPQDEQRTKAPQELILPHPRLQDRAFVLVPLCDVYPEWRHPVLDKTAAELCSVLAKSDVEAVLPVE